MLQLVAGRQPGICELPERKSQVSSATPGYRVVEPATEARASSARLGRLNACPTLPGKLQTLVVGQAVSPAESRSHRPAVRSQNGE